MKRRTRLLLILLLGCASFGFGTIYKNIGGPTPDYPDFVEAAASLPATLLDDYVFTAFTGVYNEGQVRLYDITTGIFSITFRAGSGQSVTVGPGSDQRTFYIQQTSNVYLERLTIRGGEWYAVYLYQASANCAVRACSVFTVGSCGIEAVQSNGLRVDSSSILVNNSSNGSTGVKLSSSDDCVVKGCRIRGVPDHGVWVEDALDADVDSCQIEYGGSAYAVYVNASSHNTRIRRSVIACWGEYGVWVNSSDYVEVSAMRIDQSSTGQGAGIRFPAQSRYGRIRGCVINTARYDGILVENNSTNLAIDSCQVNQLTAGNTWGIRLWGSDACRVSRCSVTTAGYTGIYVQGSNYVKIDSTTVVGSNSQCNDVFADNGAGCRLLGCILRGAARAGVCLADGSNGDSIVGCRFLNTGSNGIVLWPGSGQNSNHVIANNFISGYSAAGINLYNQYAPRLYYNTVVGPTSALVSTQGILVNTAVACTLKNNIVWNRHSGASLCYDLSNALAYSFGSDYNDLYSAYKIARADGTEYPDLPYWQSQTGLDGHSISADPKLADVGTGDLHLLGNSPCIEAGAVISGVTRDIDFDARHNPPDIGADEYAMPMPGAFQLEAPRQDSANAPIDIQLVWRASANARRYDVFFGLSPASPESVATVLAPETVFSRSGLLHDTLYRWYVRARNRTGSVISTPSSSRFRTIVDVPTAFGLREPRQDSANTPFDIKLQWQRSTHGTVAYDIYWGDPPMTMVRYGLNDTFFDTTGLKNNQTYRWTVRARNVAGATWARDTFRFTTIALPAPFLLRYPRNDSQNAPIAVRLEWNPSANGVITYDVYWGNPPNQLVRAGLSTTWYDTSGLRSDTTYYWTVKASNIGGSTWSTDTFHFKTIVALPRQFHLLYPRNDSSNTPTSIRLEWEPSQNGTITYDVYWGDPPVLRVKAGLAGTSFDTSGLVPGQVYRWTVKANNIAGSTWSRDTFRFTTIALPAPFRLRYPRNDSQNAPIAVRLEWNPSANGVITYDVYWGNPPNQLVRAGLSTTWYDTSGLRNDTTCYWTVRATNIGGSTWSTDTFHFRTIVALPGRFRLLHPRNDSANAPTSIHLDWEPSQNGNITYDVYWGNPPSQLVRVGLTTAWFDTSGLRNDTTYYWTVKASNIAGSTWSTDTFLFRTIVALPGQFHLLHPCNDSADAPVAIRLEWEPAVNGTIAYDVYWGSPPSLLVRSGLSTTFYDTMGLRNDTLYYWTVKAQNSSGGTWAADTFHFQTIPGQPRAFHLLLPRNDSSNTPPDIRLEWEPSAGGTVTYDVFWGLPPGTPVSSGLTGTFYDTAGLGRNQTCYWTVRAANVVGTTWASDTFHFTTYAGGAPPSIWTRMPDMLEGVRRKNVKDGGALAYAREGVGGLGSGVGVGGDTGYVYALKGNNTCEFYRYNVVGNGWIVRESIPAYNRLMKKKGVKKGASLAASFNGRLYATKGNGTYDFWQYDPLTRIWTQKADIPAGSKTCKDGLGMVAVREGGANYIYLLKGSGTYEFYRYNADGDFWDTSLPYAPGGRSGKPFKAGSCVTSDRRDSIYCLKGSYNEFFVYSMSARNWATRETLPKVYFSGKKKVKDGAGIAWWPDVVYGLKGGNTNEFWVFRCDENRWFTAPQMPAVVKRVKGGGALIAAPEEGMLFALRGNNTREFWRYGPLSVDSLPLAAEGEQKSLQSSSSFIVHRSSLSISPNPFTQSLSSSISYSLPRPGNVSLKLYDIAGKSVGTLVDGYHAAGSYSCSLLSTHQSLASGVYLLKFETDDYQTTQKLIVE